MHRIMDTNLLIKTDKTKKRSDKQKVTEEKMYFMYTGHNIYILCNIYYVYRANKIGLVVIMFVFWTNEGISLKYRFYERSPSSKNSFVFMWLYVVSACSSIRSRWDS